MKRLIMTLLLSLAFSMPSAAQTQDVVVTLPNAAVPRLAQLCEVFRVQLPARAAGWDLQKCFEEMVFVKSLEFEKAVTKRDVALTENDRVTTAVDNFRSKWPRPVRPRCGDSTLDTEFGEQCDDGNNANGDGCSASCTTE